MLQGHNYLIKASLYKVECLREAHRLQPYLDSLDKSNKHRVVELAYGMFLEQQYSQAIEYYAKCLQNGLTDHP